MSTIDALVCGCPIIGPGPAEHKPGCWLGEVEALAGEAVTAATLAGRHRLTAVVEALADAGYLRDLQDDDDLLGVLDYLAEDPANPLLRPRNRDPQPLDAGRVGVGVTLIVGAIGAGLAGMMISLSWLPRFLPLPTGLAIIAALFGLCESVRRRIVRRDDRRRGDAIAAAIAPHVGRTIPLQRRPVLDEEDGVWGEGS